MEPRAEHRGRYLGHDIYYNPLCGWYAKNVRPGGYLGITETRETLRELRALIRECVEWEKGR